MFWLFIFLVTLGIELMTTALVSIWFAIGALVALVFKYLGFSMLIQVISFVSVSVLAIILTKPYVEKRLLTKIEKTNIDAIIGKKAIVKTEISNLQGQGEVQVEGKVWTARSIDEETIPINETVIVERIEGVKLIVSKTNKE